MCQKAEFLQGQPQKSTSEQDSSELLSLSRGESCDWHWCPGLASSWGNWSPCSPQAATAPGSRAEPLPVVTSGSSPTAVSRDMKRDIPTSEKRAIIYWLMHTAEARTCSLLGWALMCLTASSQKPCTPLLAAQMSALGEGVSSVILVLMSCHLPTPCFPPLGFIHCHTYIYLVISDLSSWLTEQPLISQKKYFSAPAFPAWHEFRLQLCSHLHNHFFG